MTAFNELTKIGWSFEFDRGKMDFPSNYVRNDLVSGITRVPREADLYVASSSQQYPLGAKLVMGDERFRYSRAGAAISQVGFLSGNYTQCPGKAGNSVGAGFEGAAYAAVAAEGYTILIADTAATKNLYEGALLVIYNDTDNVYDQYKVIANDASNGTTTTLYISPEDGLEKAITTSYGITVYLNPYYNIRTVNGGYMSALGWVKHTVTSGYYFWLKTAGIISGVTGASTWPGQTQYYRDVYCNTDGSLIGYTAGYQRVGYLLSRTASDYGDNLVMLQLDD